MSEWKKISHKEWMGSSSEEEEQSSKMFGKKLKKNKEKIKICDENERVQDNLEYVEALDIVKKYKSEKKRLSLKQKAIYKKARALVKANEREEEEGKEKKEHTLDAFNKNRSIFDTKKGQVLFELQKSFKGDNRFKMDSRFAEDIEVDKLPNTIKQLTTGIDFENLSDGSDQEFKKQSERQQKIQKRLEKKEKKNLFEQEKIIPVAAAQPEVVQDDENDDLLCNSSFDKEWIEEFPEDYVDQEALASGEEKELESELHTYLKVLQDLMPDHKLFFQNKKKNLNIVNNSFAGYGTMLSQQDSGALGNEEKKTKKKNKKKDEEIIEDEQSQISNAGLNKEGRKKGQEQQQPESEDDEKHKKEKQYNLVIPRFDPSQFIVKKVMQTQEREREEKLREKENKSKPKKVTIEAKIEAGIDKKLQRIMKANSILDKNLEEHQKLEGVVIQRKKAPILKKIKIDSEKWKNIVLSSMNPSEISNQTNSSQESKPSHTPLSGNLGFLFATVPSPNDSYRNQFKLFG